MSIIGKEVGDSIDGKKQKKELYGCSLYVGVSQRETKKT